MIKESTINGFFYSTDKSKLNMAYIREFLSSSYWAQGIPLEVVTKSVENSLSFGIYSENQQIGFARLITDFSTFAYLADVFVDEKYRGRGASKGLMKFIQSLEFISGLRRIVLATRDAHGLYRQYGFQPLQRPDRFMEIAHTDIYLNMK